MPWRSASSHVFENGASRRIIREQDSPLVSLLAVAGAKHAMALSMAWLQAARATAPREVADEVRMQEKRAAQKTVREETALKAKIAKDKEGQEVVWTVRPLSLASVKAPAKGF